MKLVFSVFCLNFFLIIYLFAHILHIYFVPFICPLFSSCCYSYIYHQKIKKNILNVKKQWPGCNARGLCQGNSQADNYVIKYPQEADANTRASIISALMLINMVLFEKRANQKQ